MLSYQNSSFINGGVSAWIQGQAGDVTREPLAGDIDVDVAIVGGGLTGLWTAYYLKQAAPDLDIAIFEAQYVGFGASGRNGGWLSAEPAGLYRRYASESGDAAAQRLQQAMFGAVEESIRIARDKGFDEDLVHNGLIHVATNEAQMQRVRNKVAEMYQQGWAETDVELISAGQLTSKVNVDGALGGYWSPHAARIHPAKYTLGLAAAVEKMGVTIYESTAARTIEPHRVDTNRGTVSARFVVQALEGYTHTLQGQARRMLPMNSSMAITEPLTDEQWSVIGWESEELLGDVAHSFTYLQRTADNRIAIGGRGVPYNFASSHDFGGKTAGSAVAQLHNRLSELFPVLASIKFEQTWSGVLGVPRDWTAAVNYDRDSGVIIAGGYVGHGLSGTNLAGRTVRDLLLQQDTDLTRLPWVNRHSRNWEVEPIRWIGAQILYSVYRYADRKEYALGSRDTHWTGKLAHRLSGRY